MKSKNEYLIEQGIDPIKDFSVTTYTKLRFAMEEHASDYHQDQMDVNLSGIGVSGLKSFISWLDLQRKEYRNGVKMYIIHETECLNEKEIFKFWLKNVYK